MLGALFAILLERHRTRKLYDRLDGMLDAAIRGSFLEYRYDESRQSALEARLAHYLAASEVSARNVALEKDRIKALISDISHQTKTPVANLLLDCELLEEQELSAQARENVEALHGQVQKLRFLIDSLVKLSRLESGILTFSPKERKVYPMLLRIREQFAPFAAKKGLYLELEPTEASACFDEKWMGEALCNLVENAVKYTEEGGVRLSVKEYELFVCICVEDTGSGIAEEEQGKVFQRFYRSPFAGDKEGVGIGLYLAREIVSGQGGYIRLDSKEGKGSAFRVYLPVE